MSTFIPSSEIMSKTLYQQGVKKLENSLKPNSEQLTSKLLDKPDEFSSLASQMKTFPGKPYRGDRGQLVWDLVRSHPEIVQAQREMLSQKLQSLKESFGNIEEFLTQERGGAEFDPKQAVQGLLEPGETLRSTLYKHFVTPSLEPVNRYMVDTLKQKGSQKVVQEVEAMVIKLREWDMLNDLFKNRSNLNLVERGGNTVPIKVASDGSLKLLEDLLKADS